VLNAWGNRRLLGLRRFLETSAEGPPAAIALQSRRVCRSESPSSSLAFILVSRLFKTRCNTSARFNSRALMVTRSIPSPPALAESGHFYLGGSGHLHVGATDLGQISSDHP